MQALLSTFMTKKIYYPMKRVKKWQAGIIVRTFYDALTLKRQYRMYIQNI